MSRGPGVGMTFPEIFDLPLAVDLRTAARALGICRATAYQLIARDDFPCPILRIGWSYRVPTAGLLRALGIEQQPVRAADLSAGAEHAARWEHTSLNLDLFESEDFA